MEQRSPTAESRAPGLVTVLGRRTVDRGRRVSEAGRMLGRTGLDGVEERRLAWAEEAAGYAARRLGAARLLSRAVERRTGRQAGCKPPSPPGQACRQVDAADWAGWLRGAVKNPPPNLNLQSSAMSSSSSSLLSSTLPTPATVLSKKPASLRAAPSRTARRGVRVVAAAAAAVAPVSAASRARLSAAEVARTVVELAPSGTLSVVGPDSWPLGVGARFVTDAADAPALRLAAAMRRPASMSR
ncbi:hypothetical protein C2845_PM04G13110 [Panicum miliaceum]|uniref:Uncharacterized protein n=1 Tax=Panicum miliaceum TaxID=4540 RepID=A0A3L6QUN8_PANMI|nr:hypothetical protein C2845_PM04G13110 [Panicum miliaceum]